MSDSESTRYPLYAADKVWQFDGQNYIGPLAGQHAETVFTRIYHMNFHQFFHSTKLFAELFSYNTVHSAENVQKFLEDDRFFTKFFQETLTEANIQIFSRLASTLYNESRKYHERLRFNPDALRAGNPFAIFVPYVQRLFNPRLDNHMDEIYVSYFSNLAGGMDEVVVNEKNRMIGAANAVIFENVNVKLNEHLRSVHLPPNQHRRQSLFGFGQHFDALRFGLLQMQERIDEQQKRSDAVAMGVHARLGRESHIHGMDLSTVEAIITMSRQL
eukprot:2456614-Rhodomonas_salina.1